MSLQIKLSDLTTSGNSGLNLTVTLDSTNKKVTVSSSQNMNDQNIGNESQSKNKTYSYTESPDEVISQAEADFGFSGLIVP